ncbi:hypothetical protein [Salipiger mucosus]|uniref:Uncharacterized protein n=1 Tax=Salipiger mucosus DSM 16094 TaxID=1123237 RepID=S9S7B2_9RHOB|nr:hypothetical protein [Salipiger mucosus]EPX82084.1 hypothetical protein Salmuc_02451 [Salipiger mucosus DSM 16094]
MTSTERTLRAVDSADLPDYPISSSERLDSHYFLQWNLKRWRASSFRKLADPEVGWYGFNLFCVAQDSTPLGTLSCDDRELAADLNIPLERWQQLCKRDISPLNGWHRYRCDNGEVRLGHSVVIEVAQDALTSKRRNAAKNAEDRMRKRLRTIAEHLRKISGGVAAFADDDARQNAVSDWIERAYPGGSATERRVREAINDLSNAEARNDRSRAL